MSFDNAHDFGVEALGILAKGAVNAKLQPIFGRSAIAKVFGAPLPVALLSQSNAFPCMCIYRAQDRDRNLGDFVFDNVTTFRFDYVMPATPLEDSDKRRHVMRMVWEVLLGVMRVGRDPAVANEVELLKNAGLFRYALGSARCDFTFLASGSQTLFPAFRGTMDFEGEYITPDSFYDDLLKCERLDTFAELHVDWDLVPELNIDIEAQDIIVLPQ
jgi:hypothetical protein